jgi:hypothetical protein
MNRRKRLFVVAFAVVVAAVGGAAWWLSSDGLTSSERRLVGSWRSLPDPKTGAVVLTFAPDRRYRFETFDPKTGEMVTRAELVQPWYVRDGVVLVECEPNAIRRAVRPILRLLGVAQTEPAIIGPASITADEIVFTLPAGARQVWTRAVE